MLDRLLVLWFQYRLRHWNRMENIASIEQCKLTRKLDLAKARVSKNNAREGIEILNVLRKEQTQRGL